jgi:anti-anti-sigma factor
MPEPQFRHVRCRLEDGVLVITIAEQQVQGDELADALRQEFFQALDHFQAGRAVLDFQEVKYLGSAGFRPLLSLHRRLRGQGGALLLCNLSPEVAEVFHITRLISTSRSYVAPFETAPSVAEAVARLKA